METVHAPVSGNQTTLETREMRVEKSLDEQVWGRYVGSHPHGNIFLTPEMFQVFSRAKGYKPAVWAALDDASHPLALMMPVQITLMNGMMRPFTTRAVAYGSLIGSSDANGQKALDLLLSTYNNATRSDILFTELRNVSDLGPFQATLKKHDFLFEDHLNYLIDLTQTSEKLWKNIRSNAQRNIRKAQKSGVTIELGQSLDDVRSAYVILKDVYERIQVPLPDISLFESAFEILHPKNMMHILFAKLNGVNIGALTLLLYNGNILYWYTGPLREYSEYRAGDLMVWSALELGKQQGCHTFDFGGGGKPNEEYGVRDFKLKFGGQEVNYGRNTCVHSPTRLRVSEFGYSILRKFL